MRHKTLTVSIYLLAAVAVSWLLIWSRQVKEPFRLGATLCFFAGVLFAFAAARLSRTPNLAHLCALSGVVALPWVYTTFVKNNIYTNYWIVFNVPDRELFAYGGLLKIELTIVSVALVVLGIAVSSTRLLPDHWMLRGRPLCDRTWPAVAATFCFVAVWFIASVMPYRIPGAVDYSSWPMLQILHVQKHGLQFHETCIKVVGYGGTPQSVWFSWNDRRLFEYRFQQKSALIEVPTGLWGRVASQVEMSRTMKSNRQPIKPLRRWNDEGWYINGEYIETQAYTKENQTQPPQSVVDLFQDLEQMSRSHETSAVRKDVCLGFCYDPLGGLGALYANHRCRYEGDRVICR